MNELKSFIDGANRIIWATPAAMPALVVLLVGTGLYLTIRFRLIQIFAFKHAVQVIAGWYDNPDDEGEISHFQALTSALSATIGIGNIAGVATAIHYGGPGALFWMWVTASVGMATKFAECTLSHHYREVAPDGTASGGPMYYIEKGLGRRWKWLAVLFAACTVISSFGTGNSVQSFTVADSMRADFGVPNWITGLVLASVVALVVVGGIKRIGRVTSRLVPFMFLLYVGGALAVLFLNLERIPETFALILRQAFTPSGAVGGAAGSTVMFTLTWGVKRGLFSNEAGQGSAPIAHAAARTQESVREGVVAMVGPFVDTLLVCTLTGLVIVVTGAYHSRVEDAITLGAGSGVTVVDTRTGGEPVGRNGTVDPDRLFTGRVPVVSGKPQGVAFVRNHSRVTSARLTLDSEPLDGTLVVEAGAVQSVLRGAQVLQDVVLEGEMLQNGSPLTAFAFRRALGHWGGYIVTFGVLLFAVSTAISWSYYGDRAIRYLLGPRAVLPYRLVYILVYFVAALFPLEVVWGFGDAALGLMSIPNLIALFALSGVVVRLSRDYFARTHERVRR